MAVSMTPVIGSTSGAARTATRPLVNHASGSARTTAGVNSCSPGRTLRATPHDPAAARITGQWLAPRRSRPKRPTSAAAARGSPGISQSDSDIVALAPLGHLAGRRQARHGLLDLRRGQGLDVHRRLHARLAEVLPEAHVERPPGPVEHE